MQNCFKCTRVLSTPYNLRRHLKLCHDIQVPSKAGKTKTIPQWESLEAHQQKGGGGGVGNDEDSTETDEDSDVTDDETASEDDGNWVFDRILNCIDKDN